MARLVLHCSMVTAAISIRLHEEFGLTAVSLRHPAVEFRYLAGIEEPDRGIGLVEARASNLEEILREVEATSAVRSFELLDRYEERAVFQYETDVAELYRVVREAGIVPTFPYVIRDGKIEFTTTTTSDRLSRLSAKLRSLGISFDVRSISQTFGDRFQLTDRQREFVEAAVEGGYYDTPRTCTLTELAEELGVASSTASQILQRAEGHLVKRYVEGGSRS